MLDFVIRSGHLGYIFNVFQSPAHGNFIQETFSFFCNIVTMEQHNDVNVFVHYLIFK